MQAVLSRLLNVVVTIICLFFFVTVLYIAIVFGKILIDYIIVSLDPNTVMSMTFATFTYEIWPGFGAILFLILAGSMVYYFKSNQPRMKVISSIGCISMVLTVLIFSIFKYL